MLGRNTPMVGVRATAHSSVDIGYEAGITTKPSGLRSQCVSGGHTSANFETSVAQADAPLLKTAGHLVTFDRIIPPHYRPARSSARRTAEKRDDPAVRRPPVALIALA